MKPLVVSAFFCLVFSSCASILNTNFSKTTVLAKQPIIAIVDSDTIHVQDQNFILSQARKYFTTTIKLERSKQPKELIVINQNKPDTIVLQPKWSESYTANFMTLGIGFLVDGETNKKMDVSNQGLRRS